MSPSNILFKISGSIAAYKSCFVISRLVQEGHHVQVVTTKNALQFIGVATFEGLTGRPVLSDCYSPGHMMDHIHLAKWADLTLVCPASANLINKLAYGMGNDLVTTLFLAHDLTRQPYLIAPAMNQAMWHHPATQTSLAKLQEWGVQILEPDNGHQACGDVGPGRLAEPEQILKFIHLLMRKAA
jgi:phosphopantothenoylcysteine decarboxylase / phosphopantothenate---cysteine ligase